MAVKARSRQPSPKLSKVSTSFVSLYEILNVDKTSTAAQIRQAYYKLALKYHPDRVGSPEDTKRFTEIGFAYEILGSPEKRELYDSNPYAFDSNNSDITKFSQMFTNITKQDIDEFQKYYIGSVEEYEDLLSAYVKHKGKIAKILQDIFFASSLDEGRYIDLIKRAISRGIVSDYWLDKKSELSSEKQSQRQKKAENEAKEAEEYAKKLGLSADGSNLASLIQSRQRSRLDDTISFLESKYASTSPSIKRNRNLIDSDEIDPPSSGKSKRIKGNY